jgi:hypothetical protein
MTSSLSINYKVREVLRLISAWFSVQKKEYAPDYVNKNTPRVKLDGYYKYMGTVILA